MDMLEVKIIDVQEASDTKVAILKGKLDILGSNELSQKIIPIIEKERFQLIIDLGQVNYINSTGIFCLTRIYTEMKERGDSLKLISINDSIKQTLDIMGILKIIPFYNDLKDAIQNI